MVQTLAEKLKQTGPAKRKEWPQCNKESSCQERHSCLYKKKKSNKVISPDCKTVKQNCKKE